MAVKDIDFTSEKKKKSDIDTTIDSLDADNDNSNIALHPVTSTPKPSKKQQSPNITKPSSAELDAFYKSLSECKIKPVCLIV